MNRIEKKLEWLFVEKFPRLTKEAKIGLGKAFPWTLFAVGLYRVYDNISIWAFYAKNCGPRLNYNVILRKFELSYVNIPCLSGSDKYVLVAFVLVQILILAGGLLLLLRRDESWRVVLYGVMLDFGLRTIQFSIWGVLLDVILAYLLYQLREMWRKSAVDSVNLVKDE